MSGKGGVHPPKGIEQQAKAEAITNEINSMQTQPPITLDVQGGADGTAGQISNQFPAMLVPRDPYDDTFAMKQRNVERNPYGAETIFTQELTKEDLDYQKRKQEVVNNIRYKTWLTNCIDMSDPASVALAREKGVLSDYYDDREKLIDYWHDVSAKIAKMKLLGRSAWGPEDYKLAFAIKTGVLKLPHGSLMDPASYKLEGPDEATNFQRGFFNPKRMFKQVVSKYLRSHEDPFPDLGDFELRTDSIRIPGLYNENDKGGVGNADGREWRLPTPGIAGMGDGWHL